MGKRIITSALFLFFLFFLVIEKETHFVAKIWDDKILDNKNHYLPCDELPPIDHVAHVVKEHKDVVEQIVMQIGREDGAEDASAPYWADNEVSQGPDLTFGWFNWGESEKCSGTGRGDIIIYYPSHADRVMIEKIIGDDTFFGVPYRLRNI